MKIKGWRSVGLVPFVSVVVLVALVWGLWVALYPDVYDAKNLDYVLWKHGLNKRMNLDHAVEAMTGDPGKMQLVAGLNQDQLTARFGRVRTLAEASPYERTCATTLGPGAQRDAHPNRTEALFLRKSNWMVVLMDGKVVDLWLCKGY